MRSHQFFDSLERVFLERIGRPARIGRFFFLVGFLPAYAVWVLRDGFSWLDALPLPVAFVFGLTQLWARFGYLSLWSGCALIASVVIASGGESSPFLFLFLLPILSYGVEKNYSYVHRSFLVNSAFYIILLFLSWRKGNVFALSYLVGLFIAGYVVMRVFEHNLSFLEWQIRTLRKQAFRDPLTSLLNRAALEYVVFELALQKVPFALLVADLDGFKRYNDRKGHLAGDKLLQEVSRILQESFRSQDLIFRYGGDEFVILIPEGTAPLARDLAERLKKNLLFAVEGEVGISCGIALFPHEGKTLEDLLQVADRRLYEEKARMSPGYRRTTEDDSMEKEHSP